PALRRLTAREAQGLGECLAIDITARERAEEAERQTTRLRTTADLAAAAAREINGPLTTVLTNLALLRLDGEPAARVDKALEAARRIQDTLHRMTGTDSGIAPTGRGIPARPESKC